MPFKKEKEEEEEEEEEEKNKKKKKKKNCYPADVFRSAVKKKFCDRAIGCTCRKCIAARLI